MKLETLAETARNGYPTPASSGTGIETEARTSRQVNGAITICIVIVVYVWSMFAAVRTHRSSREQQEQTDIRSSTSKRAATEAEVLQFIEKHDEELRQKIMSLYTTIKNHLANSSEDPAGEDNTQIELGRWINILSDVNSQVGTSLPAPRHWIFRVWRTFVDYLGKGPVDPEDMFARVDIAVASLLAPKPKLRLVREIRFALKNDLLWNGGIFQRLLIRLNGGSPTMTVVWGAACTMVVGFLLLILVYPWAAARANWQIIFLHPKIVLGTAVPAFLGAVVSILSRLQDFSDAESTDPKILFMTAFFKPYIGMISGLFIVSAIGLGIGSMLKDIELTPSSVFSASASDWPPLKDFYFLYVVGFLAGFSERLTKDFIGAAEDRIAPRGRAAAGRSANGDGS